MDDNCYYQPTNDPITDTEPYKIFTVSVMEEVFEQYDFAKNQLKLIDRVKYIFEDMYKKEQDELKQQRKEIEEKALNEKIKNRNEKAKMNTSVI